MVLGRADELMLNHRCRQPSGQRWARRAPSYQDRLAWTDVMRSMGGDGTKANSLISTRLTAQTAILTDSTRVIERSSVRVTIGAPLGRERWSRISCSYTA